MDKQMSSGLRLTFLLHFIVALVIGLIYLLIPAPWGNLVNWPIQEPPVYRLLGAAILAFGASSWWAYRAVLWERVRIVVQTEIAWATLGTLVMLWALLFAGLPTFGWVNAIILGAFAVAFTFFYTRERG